MVFNNIFGEIQENNFTLVIDTSCSMQDMMPIVKNHLISNLMNMSSTRPGCKFNIVATNSQGIIPWSENLVECSSYTVGAALRWLTEIRCKKNKNILEAVRIAFLDKQCNAVYLVLDGVDEENPREYKFDFPIHCILLSTKNNRLPDAEDTFCEDLATMSRGSFNVAILTDYGDVKRVIPVYNSINAMSSRRLKLCSVKTALNVNPVFTPSTSVFLPPYVGYMGPHLALDPVAIREDFHKTPIASVVARGTRVLARKHDGYYYTGHIAQEVEKSQSEFLIEFDRMKRGCELRMEEVPLHDIIALHDAERHSVVPGDKVLARWTDRARYGPGDVISGVENRQTIGDRHDSDIVVTFWNGKTQKVKKGEATWIPNPLYDRIVTELQMPISAKRPRSLYPREDIKPTLYDELLEVPFLDPLQRNLYYPWWSSGYHYLPTYPLLTCVPRYLRTWPHFLYHQPHVLYEQYPWQYRPDPNLSYRRYPEPRKTTDSDNELEASKYDLPLDDVVSDIDLDEDKYSGYSSSSSDSSSDESVKYTYKSSPETRDKGVNTDYRRRLIRTRGPRPEWKKYWPQTPQPRFHHRPKTRTQLEYERSNLERQKELYGQEDCHYARAMEIEDCKRLKSLMRITSDMEKQRKYEEKVQRTIDGKSQINQAFRQKFYEKEMENLDRKNLHQQWLQERRSKYEDGHNQQVKALEHKERIRQLDKQLRQMSHQLNVARGAAIQSNYEAAVEAKKRVARLNKRAHLLDVETRHR